MTDANKNTQTSELRTKQPLFIDGVSGSICVIKGTKQKYKRVVCGGWFDGVEYFITEDDGECFVIKKCYMEIPKRARKIDRNMYLEFIGEIPIGTFDIDEEESNEDELVVYYR